MNFQTFNGFATLYDMFVRQSLRMGHTYHAHPSHSRPLMKLPGFKQKLRFGTWRHNKMTGLRQDTSTIPTGTALRVLQLQGVDADRIPLGARQCGTGSSSASFLTNFTLFVKRDSRHCGKMTAVKNPSFGNRKAYHRISVCFRFIP